MPNGRPGDHPITDLFKHGREVYGREVDALLVEISRLSPHEEFMGWWEREIAPEPDRQVLLGRARARLARLRSERP